MERCIELAQLGLGHVAPNPQVGALIVHDGQVIGEGYHANFGDKHAEVAAIEAVQDRSVLSESTLYVSLEPCCVQGKTPACSDLIKEAGIKKVVVGCEDPNPAVSGKSIALLREAGIKIEVGILESECKHLIRRFATYHQKKRPYIILKWAQTLDGFMDRVRASNEPRINWITSDETKKLTHLWRSQEQAILVGSSTVVNDNPLLTVRAIRGNSPIRIVLDPNRRASEDSKVFSKDTKTWVYNFKEEGVQDHIEFIKLDSRGELIEDLLADLYKREIISLTVEGGKMTLESFIDSNLWDEARMLVGMKTFGFGLEAPRMRESHSHLERYGEDLILRYYNTAE